LQWVLNTGLSGLSELTATHSSENQLQASACHHRAEDLVPTYSQRGKECNFTECFMTTTNINSDRG